MSRPFLKAAAVVLVLAIVARVITQAGGHAGHGLKQVFIPFVQLYLDTFNSPTTAIVLCLGMVAIAIVLAAYYWRFRFAPTLVKLRMLSRELGYISAPPGSDEAVERIDTVMDGSDLLARAWFLYKSTLERDPRTGKIVARTNPDRYLNMKALQMAGLRLRVFMGLPNDFVGVGLIFTFLGLVAGLFFATHSMMSPDLGAARRGLVLLLHAATFKFLTSITGIFLSIVFSGMQRVLIDRVQHALFEVQYQCERVLAVPFEPASSAIAPAASAPARLAKAEA